MFTRIPEYADNAKILAITKRGFYSLVSSETEIFHACVARQALNKLNPESDNFNNEYNKIIFGSMVYELAMEADKYCKEYYPLMCYQLLKLCDIETLNCDSMDELTERGRQLITTLGEKILNKELEFTLEHLMNYFNVSSKYVQNHLPGGCPNLALHKTDSITFKDMQLERYNAIMQQTLVEEQLQAVTSSYSQ